MNQKLIRACSRWRTFTETTTREEIEMTKKWIAILIALVVLQVIYTFLSIMRTGSIAGEFMVIPAVVLTYYLIKDLAKIIKEESGK